MPMSAKQPTLGLDPEDVREFVDEISACAHADEKVFEETLSSLILRVPAAILDKFLKELEKFKDELGTMLVYVQNFVHERQSALNSNVVALH